MANRLYARIACLFSSRVSASRESSSSGVGTGKLCHPHVKLARFPFSGKLYNERDMIDLNKFCQSLTVYRGHNESLYFRIESRVPPWANSGFLMAVTRNMTDTIFLGNLATSYFQEERELDRYNV